MGSPAAGGSRMSQRLPTTSHRGALPWATAKARTEVFTPTASITTAGSEQRRAQHPDVDHGDDAVASALLGTWPRSPPRSHVDSRHQQASPGAWSCLWRADAPPQVPQSIVNALAVMTRDAC